MQVLFADISIASSAIRAGDKAPQLVEALRKAGVEDLPDAPNHDPSDLDAVTNHIEELEDLESTHEQVSMVERTEPIKGGESKENLSPDQTDNSLSATDEKRSLGRKKSVSFAEGTKTEDSKISRKRQPHPLFAKPKPMPHTSKTETIAEVKAKTPEGQLNALLHAEADILAKAGVSATEDEEIVSPVIPQNESPEDAALRRQMLQYNMKQVGSVVAEINLDEQGEGSTPPYSDDEDEEDDDSSVEEEEDDHGRATNIMFSDEYVKQMQALEEKLNASAIRNVGPSSNMDPLSSGITKEPEPVEGQTDRSKVASPTDSTKGVRFAENLNIQDAPKLVEPANVPVTLTSHEQENKDPDRGPGKKKVSRFKSARATGAGVGGEPSASKAATAAKTPILNKVVERPPPSGPPDRPLAENIIERPYTASSNPDDPPQEPDDFDPALLQQEARTEYHRHRNRMIYRQGGFLPQDSDEDDEVPLDANGKKTSRFKAARLGRD